MSAAMDEVKRYQLDEPFTYRSEHLRGIEFANRWTKIRNGELYVKEDYTWDGCTPTWYVPIFGWVGTPDGTRDESGKPQSYYASLAHDVLCRFRSQIRIDKATTVAVFKELLILGGFPMWRANLYAGMVDKFGPQDWLGFAPAVAA